MKLPGVRRARPITGSLGSCLGFSADHHSSSGEPSSAEGSLCREDFEVVELLGSGGFAEVKLVRHKGSEELFAMKAVEKVELVERKNVGDAGAPDRAQFERDVGMMARYWDCPFIVELVGAFQTREKLYYIFEFCPGGELFALLQAQPGGRFNEDAARFYAAEVCLALERLHDADTVHRDVRLENVLLTKDGHVKLADFGCAKQLLADSCRPSCVFTFGNGRTEIFYPPEFVHRQDYGKDLDCWQLGVALFTMLAGHLPGTGASAVSADAWPPPLPEDGDAGGRHSKEVCDLCARLLAPQRTERLGFPDGAGLLRRHSFFSGPGFWDAISALAITPPSLTVASSKERTSKTQRWPRPTVKDWTHTFLFNLKGFSFTSSRLLSRPSAALSRAHSFVSSRSSTVSSVLSSRRGSGVRISGRSSMASGRGHL